MTQTMDNALPTGWTQPLPADFWDWLSQIVGQDAVTAAHTDAKSLSHFLTFYGTSKGFMDWFATSRFNNARFAERMAADPQKAQSYIFSLRSQYEQTDPAGKLKAAWIATDPITGLPGDATKEQKDTLNSLLGYLQDNDLPVSLLGWLRDAILQGKSEAQIRLELPETPEFKQAYPEWALRQQNGFARITLDSIRQSRDALSDQTFQTFGYRPSRDQLASLIGGDVSANEWQKRLDVRKQVIQFGGAVKDLYQQEYGHVLDDQTLQDLFDPDKNTGVLEHALENAIYRGFQKNLGLDYNVTSEQADQLRSHGVSTQDAMNTYLGLANYGILGHQGLTVNAIQRLKSIDAAIAGDQSNPFGTFTEAFNAAFGLDPSAQADIFKTLANEIARWSPQGGIAGGGQGLLTRFQRAGTS